MKHKHRNRSIYTLMRLKSVSDGYSKWPPIVKSQNGVYESSAFVSLEECKTRDQFLKFIEMIFPFLLFSFYIFRAEGGELIIIQKPSSVKFRGGDAIDQHLIPEIFAAAMGFTTQQDSDWSGMSITDPFNFAEAVVVLYVDGISNLGKSQTLLKYPVNNNEDELVTWKTMRNKIFDRYPMENNTLLKIDLGLSEEGLRDLKANHLDKNVAEDAEFLKEINALSKYMNLEKKFDGVPDLYWFSLKSLHQLSDVKGPHHPSTAQAKQMVLDALTKLAEVYDSSYHGQALVVALVSDASHTRRTRSVAIGQSANATESHEDNVYDPDFPVIFNIILWFTVVLVFSLLAVSIFIASMDPGRDSIIYRMTSNRMKKDS